jgi:hypothetical protein
MSDNKSSLHKNRVQITKDTSTQSQIIDFIKVCVKRCHEDNVKNYKIIENIAEKQKSSRN